MTKRIVRIVLNALSLLILLGTVLFLMVYWKRLPDQVPAHYNARGQIDDWGGKGMLILEPIMMLALYVVFSLSKTLRFRSMGKEVRVPAPELLFPAFKLVMLAGFSYMVVCTALARPLGVWFLPVFIG
ncbi:MAG: DUF1648 domain-containing protein, partial [Oscillospiraceae bacterium]|nr:DUF1648 domain-containing protein [Oscillospiraceae bacterium]